jgi:hypothetical protein
LAPHRLAVATLLLALATACGTSRTVHSSTNKGGLLVRLPLTGETSPVELDKKDFTQAL